MFTPQLESFSYRLHRFRKYHQMKIHFILTVRMLLSNLWDTLASSSGMFPEQWRCGGFTR